jgi:hypothetical protein
MTHPKHVCPVCNGPKWSGGDRPCRKCGHVGDRQHRACEVCSETYKPTHSLQRTCSRACGVTLRRLDGIDPWPATKVAWRQCRHCSGWYTHRGKRRCTCTAYKPTSGVTSVTCRDCHTSFGYVIISNYPARCVDCRELERKRRQKDSPRCSARRALRRTDRTCQRREGLRARPMAVRPVLTQGRQAPRLSTSDERERRPRPAALARRSSQHGERPTRPPILQPQQEQRRLSATRARGVGRGQS